MTLLFVLAAPPLLHAAPWTNAFRLNFRYAPRNWQTLICLPDDWQKTLVDRDGTLLYDYPGEFDGFGTRITFSLARPPAWVRQELDSPRVPLVRTLQRAGSVQIVQEAFAVPPSLAPKPQPAQMFRPLIQGGGSAKTGEKPVPAPARLNWSVDNQPVDHPRDDVLLVQLTNTGKQSATVHAVLQIDADAPVETWPDETSHRFITVGTTTTVFFAQPWSAVEGAGGHTIVSLPPLLLHGGTSQTLAFTVARRQHGDALFPRTVAQAKRVRDATRHYWLHLKLPYNHLIVPDREVQDLLDSCIRNIYQAREIKAGLPAFEVGPTCYRGVFMADDSFILEAMTFLGCTNEVRAGIEYLMTFQQPSGRFSLIPDYWKETGIALWAITHYARLTGDRAWLRQVWPNVKRGFAYIEALRRMPPEGAPNARLIPAGYSDGGLRSKEPEYTNIYWSLAGMRAAIAAALWLDNNAEEEAWQREYDDFYATFRRAAARDMQTDAHGNRYLPIRMVHGQGIPPQKAQWAFLQAIYPGRVFSTNDPLVLGNMAMLHSHECQGLVQDTGWLKNGIWTYFGSFYAHAWLWLGHGLKAAKTLYAFANHASPLLCWREEQMPVGQGDATVGDMPHNWASAEFIRLIRNCLVLERGDELDLLEGLPPTWARPGAVTRVRNVLTSFGPVSFELKVAHNGRSARLRLRPPRREPPRRIVLHLTAWAGHNGILELPVDRNSSVRIPLNQTPLTNSK